jgi:hypothetical protein
VRTVQMCWHSTQRNVTLQIASGNDQINSDLTLFHVVLGTVSIGEYDGLRPFHDLGRQRKGSGERKPRDADKSSSPSR